jgi:amino acid transporter
MSEPDVNGTVPSEPDEHMTHSSIRRSLEAGVLPPQSSSNHKKKRRGSIEQNLLTASSTDNTTETATNVTGEGDEDPADSPKEPEKKLTVAMVTFFCFVSTASGPFGSESTVNSAGPAATLMFVFLCPLLIVLPIILMMEELGSVMPSNHGSLRWVARALGPTAGFFNAFFQQLMNTVDVAVYPALASDYLFKAFAKGTDAADNYWLNYFTRLGVVILFGIPNYFPVRDIGILSFIFTILICAPFIVGFFVGVKNIDTSSWSEFNTGEDFDLSTLLAIGLWMYTGFLSNSNISGECEPRALLKGQTIGLAIGVVMYFLPLSVVFQLDTDWNNWDDGYLVALFDKMLPGLGYAVSVAGAFSGISLYVSSLTTYCRAMFGIADLGWFPTFMKKTNRHNVPHINVTILLITTAALNLFEFDFLVKLEFVFVLSFLVFRYREPFHIRPPGAWQVPYGETFGIIMTLPLVFLVSAVIGADFTDMRLFGSWLGCTIIAFIMHIYLGKNRSKEQILSLKRLLSGDDFKGRLEDVDLRATEMCPFPWQRYEYYEEAEDVSDDRREGTIEVTPSKRAPSVRGSIARAGSTRASTVIDEQDVFEDPSV